MPGLGFIEQGMANAMQTKPKLHGVGIGPAELARMIDAMKARQLAGPQQQGQYLKDMLAAKQADVQDNGARFRAGTGPTTYEDLPLDAIAGGVRPTETYSMRF
jgi:hypothetical protein